MRDAIWKLGVLRNLLTATFGEWREQVWEKHPDAPYCCSDSSVMDPCGCGGTTVRDIYTPWKADEEGGNG